MSKTADMWLAEYEDIQDAFVGDCAQYGEEQAREIAADKMKRLGLDRREINDQLAELAS